MISRFECYKQIRVHLVGKEKQSPYHEADILTTDDLSRAGGGVRQLLNSLEEMQGVSVRPPPSQIQEKVPTAQRVVKHNNPGAEKGVHLLYRAYGLEQELPEIILVREK